MPDLSSFTGASNVDLTLVGPHSKRSVLQAVSSEQGLADGRAPPEQRLIHDSLIEP